MRRVIAYDLTRLFLGPLSQSPRGIDRVDVALANAFFSEDKTVNLGILPTPGASAVSMPPWCEGGSIISMNCGPKGSMRATIHAGARWSPRCWG
jgi:hypothetical protein